MSDVFISYAKANAEAARALAGKLKQQGYSVWWDENLLPGQSFAEELERRLADAGAVVVIWSQDSVQNRWVREEASYARELDKLIPVTIVPDNEVPLEFRMLQSVKLGSNPTEIPQRAEDAIMRAIEALIKRDKGTKRSRAPEAESGTS